MNKEVLETKNVVTKKPFKYNWSHQLWVHRFLVKAANSILRFIPFNLKYAIGKMIKKSKYPYCLIGDDFTVVQIGAPTDTLGSGRSRGMYFSLFNKGKRGKTVIIEPAQKSEDKFLQVKKQQNIDNLVFINMGAWKEEKVLGFYFDPSHPATNFAAGTVDYSEERLKEFQYFEIPADTVDTLLKKAGIEKVNMVSITTNGSENQILEGMSGLLSRGIDYMAMAGASEKDFDLMRSFGYEFISYDDRGATFKRIQ